MKQEVAASKALLEVLETGTIDGKQEFITYNYEEHELDVYNKLMQVYAVGHTAGRQLRSFTRPVAQFSLNGDLLEIFDSVQDAVRATGLNKSNIANCARGRKGCLTCGGYKWKYVNQKDGKTNDRGEYVGTIDGR